MNYNLKYDLFGALNKEKLSLNILSNEENIYVEANRCDKFSKYTISVESDLFFGKSLDMCEGSVHIELTNVELLEMRPQTIKVNDILVKFADLLDADRPSILFRSSHDSYIPDVI